MGGYNNININMDGGWELKHCEGERTYLGRLVLIPKRHRADWSDICFKKQQLWD